MKNKHRFGVVVWSVVVIIMLHIRHEPTYVVGMATGVFLSLVLIMIMSFIHERYFPPQYRILDPVPHEPTRFRGPGFVTPAYWDIILACHPIKDVHGNDVSEPEGDLTSEMYQTGLPLTVALNRMEILQRLWLNGFGKVYLFLPDGSQVCAHSVVMAVSRENYDLPADPLDKSYEGE